MLSFSQKDIHHAAKYSTTLPRILGNDTVGVRHVTYGWKVLDMIRAPESPKKIGSEKASLLKIIKGKNPGDPFSVKQEGKV